MGLEEACMMKIKFEGRFTVEEFIAAFNEQVPTIISSLTDAKYVCGVQLYLKPENEDMEAVIPVVFNEDGQPVEVYRNVQNANNHRKKARKPKKDVVSGTESERSANIDFDLLPSAKQSTGTVILKELQVITRSDEDSGEPLTLKNGQVVDIGDAVEHDKFGAGRVLRVIKGQLLYVDFPGQQNQKYLDVRFAQLRKVDS